MRLLIMAMLFLLQYAQAQQYGWVRVAQLGNQFTSLSVVEFVDSLHGWLYGSLPVGYQYTVSGGNTWMPSTSPGFASSSISMLDTLRGWAVSNGVNEGGIARTTDGGHTWIQQRLRLDRRYYGTAALTLAKNITSGSTFNFSPDTGKVVQTTNSGTTWTEQTIASNIQQLRKVQFVDSLHGWITVFGPGGVLRTTDGGQTWAHVSTSPLFSAISFIDTLNGWGIGTNTVFRTRDGGVSWIALSNVGTQFDDFGASAIGFVDSLNGWTFGVIFYQGDLAAAIYNTTDGGSSWSRQLAGNGARHILDGKMLDRYHGWAVGDFGSVFAYRIVTSVPERLERVPQSFVLHQNYPNPFNPATTIEYEILQRTHVSIKVFDTQGQEVRTLVSSEHEPGTYRIRFDARALASGIYYYTMTAATFTQTKQMAFLK